MSLLYASVSTIAAAISSRVIGIWRWIALGRFVEPIDVLLEPEDPARVRPDPLEDAVAVEQAVIEDADLGVGLVVELAADIDLGAHRRILPL